MEQKSGTIIIGKNSESPLMTNRLGYGTMRLTGKGVIGEPKDRPQALAIIKTAFEAGVNYFDTADFYGEGVTNKLLKEVLYPYDDRVIIGTKIGVVHKTADSWLAYSKPDELRKSVENNRAQLNLSTLPLVHFRVMPNSSTSFEESLETMFKLQQEGKINHVGVSNVSKAQLETALKIGIIATVQNLYGYVQRTTVPGQTRDVGGEEVLDLCEQNEIPLIPYFSLETSLSKKQEKMEEVAKKYNLSIAQLNIVWLLNKSKWLLPIPGTTSLLHLQENLRAADVVLSTEEMDYLG